MNTLEGSQQLPFFLNYYFAYFFHFTYCKFFLTSHCILKNYIMRKLFLFILGVFVATLSLHGQSVTFGAKIGANLATFTEIENIDPKVGLNFGAVASIEISNSFSIQPELFYSSQGYKQDVEGFDSKAKIDYFNIPILADLNLTQGLSLQAGPQIGINIRKELEVDGQENTGSSLGVNEVDVAAAFGLQYKFDGNLFIHARYAMGLSKVFINNEAKSSVLSFSIGFFFDRAED